MSEEVFYARVKPYNPKRGHLVRRIVCMGTLWEGGSGLPPDTIPAWTKVNAAQAEALKRFRQVDNDPYSARVFDIVTPPKREEIDQREEGYRKALLGIGHSRPISELPDVSARERNAVGTSDQPVKPDGFRMTLEDLKGAPAPTLPVADDDEDEVGGLASMPASPEATVKAAEKDLTGRAEASADFPDSEDLNADDDGDDEAALPTSVPPPKPKSWSRRRGK